MHASAENWWLAGPGLAVQHVWHSCTNPAPEGLFCMVFHVQLLVPQACLSSLQGSLLIRCIKKEPGLFWIKKRTRPSLEHEACMCLVLACWQVQPCNPYRAPLLCVCVISQARADCRSRRSALVTVSDHDEHWESLRTLVEDYFAQNPDWQKLQVGTRTDLWTFHSTPSACAFPVKMLACDPSNAISTYAGTT